jgi:hypothetical protein
LTKDLTARCSYSPVEILGPFGRHGAKALHAWCSSLMKVFEKRRLVPKLQQEQEQQQKLEKPPPQQQQQQDPQQDQQQEQPQQPLAPQDSSSSIVDDVLQPPPAATAPAVHDSEAQRVEEDTVQEGSAGDN